MKPFQTATAIRMVNRILVSDSPNTPLSAPLRNFGRRDARGRRPEPPSAVVGPLGVCAWHGNAVNHPIACRTPLLGRCASTVTAFGPRRADGCACWQSRPRLAQPVAGPQHALRDGVEHGVGHGARLGRRAAGR